MMMWFDGNYLSNLIRRYFRILPFLNTVVKINAVIWVVSRKIRIPFLFRKLDREIAELERERQELQQKLDELRRNKDKK